jgi:hypothetical protein
MEPSAFFSTWIYKSPREPQLERQVILFIGYDLAVQAPYLFFTGSSQTLSSLPMSAPFNDPGRSTTCEFRGIPKLLAFPDRVGISKGNDYFSTVSIYLSVFLFGFSTLTTVLKNSTNRIGGNASTTARTRALSGRQVLTLLVSTRIV